MSHLIEDLIHSRAAEKLLDQLGEAFRSYFRIEMEGLEHIPKKGRALIAANHSGYAGADALMICHLVHHEARRIPKIMAHRAYFEWFKLLRRASIAFGLEEASVDRGIHLLRRNSMILIFPEGEAGNFKATVKRYHLQKFHTGFLRMAIQSGAPIVPCLVIGAEESHINLGNINLCHYIKGLRIPLPVNVVPLPAKWKIRFLPPISLAEYPPESVDDRELMRRLSRKIRRQMQVALHEELRKRNYVFVPVQKLLPAIPATPQSDEGDSPF